MFLSTAA